MGWPVGAVPRGINGPPTLADPGFARGGGPWRAQAYNGVWGLSPQ